MAGIDDRPHVEFADRHRWRAWLEANHATSTGVWLVTRRSVAAGARVDYEAAVEEALCFGWVDGQAATVDAERGRQYFAPRRPGSPWAKSNRERVARLAAAGRMAPAGLAVVERAKTDGSWSVFESAERLEVPPELAVALDERPPARENWDAFTSAARRQILSWIALAKRPETRSKRIAQAANRAQQGRRANEPESRK